MYSFPPLLGCCRSLDAVDSPSIDKVEAKDPEFAELYLDARRRAAERVFDNRGNLERIVKMLESMR